MMTPFGSWLHVAAEAGALDVVKLLVSLGLDPNARGGTFGANALHEAARSGHLAVATFLRDAGAILDSSEPERNPLFGAIYQGHVAMVQWLVKSGIDHRVAYTGTYMSEMDALAFAQERGQSEIANFLESLRRAP